MCKYNDCGWCYAPEGVEKNDEDGMCLNPKGCSQYIPINFDEDKSETQNA